MLVIACGSQIWTFAIIPSSARGALPAIRGCFCSRFGRHAANRARWVVDPLELQVQELHDICEFDISTLCSSDVGCSIIVDDLSMVLDWTQHKQSLNMFAIPLEFKLPMLEDK